MDYSCLIHLTARCFANGLLTFLVPYLMVFFFFFWGLDFTAPPLKLIDLPGLDQRIMDDSLVRVCLIFLDLDALNIDVSHYIFI